MMSSVDTSKAWDSRDSASLHYCSCQALRQTCGDRWLGMLSARDHLNVRACVLGPRRLAPLKTPTPLSYSASVLFCVSFLNRSLLSCRYHKYKLQFIHTSEMPYANTQQCLKLKKQGSKKLPSLAHRDAHWISPSRTVGTEEELAQYRRFSNPIWSWYFLLGRYLSLLCGY